MWIRDRFRARTSTQIRMHHLALNRTGSDQCDFDDEIIKAARLEPRQRVHLRATLDLKDADGIGRAHDVVDRLIGHVELTEIDVDAARVADVQEAILHDGEHAESEQIDLHESGRIEIVFLPLDHGAPGHRRGLDGDDGAKRFFGEDHAPDVNGAMAWELMETGDDVGEDADAGVVRVEARF